jgi:hypothetical protein
MSSQGFSETLVTAQVDGTTLSASTTATSIIPAAAKFMLPANFFAIGKTLRIYSRGRVTTLASSTLTLDIRFGSTVVWNGGAIPLNATAKTNVSFEFEAVLTCRAVGTSATLIGVGSFTSEAVLGAVATVTGQANLPATSPVVGTAFDSTVTQVVDHFATFGSATTNALTVHQYLVEALN